MFQKVIAHPRYFLGGHRPSETSILTSLEQTFRRSETKDLYNHGQRCYK